MEKEIINRVAHSKLKTIDLEDFYPEGKRIVFDIKDWLFEGLILRETDFRNLVKQHQWEQYQDCYVALTCSTEAIIPGWTYLLLSIALEPYAKCIVIGNLNTLETAIYQNIIQDLNIDAYKNAPVIIKGCAKKPVPENAYIMIANKLKPYVTSIQFGEACSSVPLFKKG